MKIRIFNDLDKSNYSNEFFFIPTISGVYTKNSDGLVLRWGFWGILILFVFQHMKSKLKMMKRADGSYSPRGLWDNIRAAAGSGKKPTPEMLKQEKKIKKEK